MCSACFLTLPRMDTDEWSQWQNEFREQIRALRHWLKSMEMRLPPVDQAHGVWEAKETLGEGLTNGGKEGATEMRVLRCPTV
ncbi:microtubule-actin cross-linking factor 1, isoforms 1/2/3/5 isoform X2 [Tachysurus ichikawai]